MLQTNMQSGDYYGPAETGSPLEFFEFFGGVLRRQLVLILSVAITAIALGALYLLITPPTFTARATIIIDRGKVQSQLGGMFREIPADAIEVESQVQLIKSESVASVVVDKLHLDKDPEFIGPPVGLAGLLNSIRTHLLGEAHPASGLDPHHAALLSVASHLVVNRIGGYVMEIEFRSLKPERAAQVANAFADSYVEDQLNSRRVSAKQAGAWLQDRIQELGDQSAVADEAVVQFKAKNNIVAAGGRLINEQQLAELNTQLVLAREKTAETRARLDRIESIINSGSRDQPTAGTVSDTLNNPVIVKLRSQYLELASREADWSRRFGNDHVAVINLRRQIREIKGSIADELSRIAETYKSEYAIAKQRQAEIEKTVADAVSRSQDANQAQIELRQLESSADTYRGLYKSALQRNTELVQQQSFPGTEARLITRASTPTSKTSPKASIVLFIAAASGLMLGLGAGILRVSLDRVFRTPEQVESALQTTCIALAPLIKRTRSAGAPSSPDARIISRDASAVWEVVDRPLSRFAEAMRSIKSAADLSSHSIKTLGFTSSLPNEGKSTLGAAFALLVAQSGARTILIDCDLRNPALTARLAPGARHGLLEVLAGNQPLDDVIWKDPTTNLSFLPGALKSRLGNSSEILASAGLQVFFEELRKNYDCIIVDLPPVAPIVDVRSTARLVDSYVLIVEWAATKIEVVELALRKARNVHENLLGVALNKVDFKILSRYEGHRGDYYSDKYYGAYGDDKPA